MSAQQQKVVTDNSALAEAKSPQYEIQDRGEFPDLVELKPRAKAQPVRSKVHTNSPMPGVTGWILPERKQVASSTSESTFARSKRKPVFGVARSAAELGVSVNTKGHQQSRACADPQGTASDNESGELSMGTSDSEGLPDLPDMSQNDLNLDDFEDLPTVFGRGMDEPTAVALVQSVLDIIRRVSQQETAYPPKRISAVPSLRRVLREFVRESVSQPYDGRRSLDHLLKIVSNDLTAQVSALIQRQMDRDENEVSDMAERQHVAEVLQVVQTFQSGKALPADFQVTEKLASALEEQIDDLQFRSPKGKFPTVLGLSAPQLPMNRVSCGPTVEQLQSQFDLCCVVGDADEVPAEPQYQLPEPPSFILADNAGATNAVKQMALVKMTYFAQAFSACDSNGVCGVAMNNDVCTPADISHQ